MRTRPPPTAPRYEPHYGADLDPDTNEVIPITSEDQVQVYEAIMEDSSGNQTYTLLNAARYSKDNRILPRGFDKNQPIGSDIAVLGKATDDDDFVAGSDLVTYRIALPNGTTGVTIAAELNYQTLAYGFLLDLLQDEAVPEVASFRDMYNASSVRAETIATATAQVGVPGGNEPPTASFSVSCTDLACTFDGTASIDTDGTIVSYVWDFGDAATATGTTAYHTYAAAGTYSATLTVTDDLGATDSATQAVTVTAPAGGGGPGPGPGGPRRGR